jgi:hypothetical protein
MVSEVASQLPVPGGPHPLHNIVKQQPNSPSNPSVQLPGKLTQISTDHDRVAHGGYYGRKAERGTKHEWNREVNSARAADCPKHKKATTMEQAKKLSAPRRSPSQYYPGIKTTKLEREALKKGKKMPAREDKGSTYVEHTFPYEIGMANGEPTRTIRVEKTNSAVPEIHGHPRHPRHEQHND